MSKPLRVLLVEDSERDEALLLMYLKRGGYEPTVRRVQTAISMKVQLDSGEWDVIVSDFNLPGFDGLSALKVLKESGHDIPFIVVSAEMNRSVIDGLVAGGATEFLGKFEMRQIVPAIERAMEARRK